MRLFFVFSLLTAALAAAEGPMASGTAGQAQSSVIPAGIPAGAVEAAPYLYRYTDREGKSWFYHQTPFGVMRFRDQTAAAKDPWLDNIRATEDGAAVRFERPGPFGIYHWTRNKSELDASEQAAWDRERARLDAKKD
jgi:hypothetical protein